MPPSASNGTRSNRKVTLALAVLTVAAVGLTVYMRFTAQHGMQPLHYAPAIILTASLIAWPFANGWRPFAKPLHTCPACHAQWAPGEDGATRFCPACGT